MRKLAWVKVKKWHVTRTLDWIGKYCERNQYLTTVEEIKGEKMRGMSIYRRPEEIPKQWLRMF